MGRLTSFGRGRHSVGDVTRAAEDDLRLVAPLGRCPIPDGSTTSTVLDGGVRRRVLELWLLVDDDQVHVGATAEAVTRDYRDL